MNSSAGGVRDWVPGQPGQARFGPDPCAENPSSSASARLFRISRPGHTGRLTNGAKRATEFSPLPTRPPGNNRVHARRQSRRLVMCRAESTFDSGRAGVPFAEIVRQPGPRSRKLIFPFRKRPYPRRLTGEGLSHLRVAQGRPQKPPSAARRACVSSEAYEGHCGMVGRQRLKLYSDKIQETNELHSR